jgi:hypothetical protein
MRSDTAKLMGEFLSILMRYFRLLLRLLIKPSLSLTFSVRNLSCIFLFFRARHMTRCPEPAEGTDHQFDFSRCHMNAKKTWCMNCHYMAYAIHGYPETSSMPRYLSHVPVLRTVVSQSFSRLREWAETTGEASGIVR